MRVAGLDLSLTKSGLALPDGELVTITPARGLEGYARHWDVAKEVLERLASARVDVVVVEGYSHHGPGAIARIRAAEVGGIVRTSLYRAGLLFVEVPPASLKRWATGNGNAGKPAVITRALELGAILSSSKADDEADAFLLRAMGRHAYNADTPAGAHLDAMLDALSVIVWPLKAAA